MKAMAISKALTAALLLISFLVVQIVQSEHETMDTNGIGRSLLQEIDCGSACAARCQLSSRQKICMRACGTCCARCSCVPPGTSGNEDACPCYANMTTHGGKHKCP